MAQPAPSCSPGCQQEKLGCCSDAEILLTISKSPSDKSRVSLLSAQPHQNYCQVHGPAPKPPDRLPASQFPASGTQHSFHLMADPVFPQHPISPKCLTEFWPRRCKTSVGYVIFRSYNDKKSLNKINFRSVFNFQCFHPSRRGKVLCFRFNLSELVKQREMHHFRSSIPFNKLAWYFQTKAGRWETKPWYFIPVILK